MCVPAVRTRAGAGAGVRLVVGVRRAVRWAVRVRVLQVQARDVRLSKMITVCMAGVPLLWAAEALAMRFLLRCSASQTLLFLFW